MNLNDYGHAISDSEGNLKNIDDVVEELTEILKSHSIESMSDHALFLNGQRDALEKIIEYLKRI